MNKIKALFVERINHKFIRMTKSRQMSGLSVCIRQITEALGDEVAFRSIDSTYPLLSMVDQHKPEKLILESLWITEGDMQLLKKYYPQMKVYCHIHSNLDFLAEEPSVWLFFKLFKKYDITVITNSKSLYSAWPFEAEVMHMPNIYKPNSIPPLETIERGQNKPTLEVGCHGSVRPMKNQLVQAVAAILLADELGKKLRFHMNLGRVENKGETCRSSILSMFSHFPQHELVNDPWLSHREFIDQCKSLDIGMQVSTSETFNIVAADYVSAGLPIITSKSIEWAANSSKCPVTNDANLIMFYMKFILKSGMQNNLVNAAEIAKMYPEAVKKWKDFINEV